MLKIIKWGICGLHFHESESPCSFKAYIKPFSRYWIFKSITKFLLCQKSYSINFNPRSWRHTSILSPFWHLTRLVFCITQFSYKIKKISASHSFGDFAFRHTCTCWTRNRGIFIQISDVSSLFLQGYQTDTASWESLYSMWETQIVAICPRN